MSEVETICGQWHTPKTFTRPSTPLFASFTVFLHLCCSDLYILHDSFFTFLRPTYFRPISSIADTKEQPNLKKKIFEAICKRVETFEELCMREMFMCTRDFAAMYPDKTRHPFDQRMFCPLDYSIKTITVPCA